MQASEAEPLRQVSNTHVRQGGRTLLFFGGCDYHRLSRLPAVGRALRKTLRQMGLTVASSRRTSGNHPLYAELERQLCRFFKAESALVTPTGYSADLILAQGLAGQFSHCLIDAGSHSALAEAAAALGCPVFRFACRSVTDLEKTLRRCGPHARPVLLTDGLFSIDGSVAPLAAYDRVLPRDAVMVVDDAHGAGVLGDRGRGTLELAGISRRRTIQTVTLSKAFGAFGGAVLGSPSLRKRLVERSVQFAGSTPIPLPLAAAAIAAFDHMEAHPESLDRLRTKAAFVKRALFQANLVQEITPGPIVQIFPASKARASAAKSMLLRHRIYPSFTNYHLPGSDGYFRFVISSVHTWAQLEQLVVALVAHRGLFRALDRSNP